jgi:hypothetical protein
MWFLVHSSKTKQWLYSEPSTSIYRRNERAGWVTDINGAHKYKTPAEALNAMKDLSTTSKAHIVLWDGVSTWNVSESKA